MHELILLFIVHVYPPKQMLSCHIRLTHKGLVYDSPPNQNRERTLKEKMIVCLNMLPIKDRYWGADDLISM
jgi:hypothetical protein